jgi:subtilase family serine protease
MHRPRWSARRRRDRRGCAGLGGPSLVVRSGAVALVATASFPAAFIAEGGVRAPAVSGVSVQVAPPYPGAQANYIVDFKATARVGVRGDIFLSETAGPTGFPTEMSVRVSDVTRGWQFLAAGVRFGSGISTRPLALRGAGQNAAGAMEVPLKDTIKTGDSVSVVVAGVTNPQGERVSDFDVYTTSNPTAGLATPYMVLSPAEVIGTGCTLPPGQNCYSLQAFRAAYGISPLLARGIDGRGRTVVLVEWFASAVHGIPSSNIFRDISAFDSYFHLPPVKLSVVPGTAPRASRDLAMGEEVEDVEMVHAVAPGAAIRVILTGPRTYSASAAVSDLEDVASASSGADAVSMSGGAWEDCFTAAQLAEAHSLISQLVDRHVTVTASSGDAGVADVSCSAPWGPLPKRGVQYPASDPLVLAVGGTTLVANPTTGSYLSETAWDSPNHGSSGGGFSRVFARPAYQDGVRGVGAHRGVPDVAADAGDSTGLALINELGSGPIMATAAGTSAGAPFWAGLVTLADQYAGRDLGTVNPAIYRIAQSAGYHSAFHDVEKGDDTVVVAGKTLEGYRAGPGWSPVTGWGTPVASVLVPLLARYDRS